MTTPPLIPVESLRTAQVPTPDEIAAHGPTDHIPNGFLHATGQPSFRVWVDHDRRRIWAALPVAAHAWRLVNPQAPHTEPPAWTRRLRPNRGGEPGVPAQVLRLVPWGDNLAAEILDIVMPPEHRYPETLPPECVRILRRNGWAPEEVRRLWWTIDTEDDARALVSHSYRWWTGRLHDHGHMYWLAERERWPLTLTNVYPGRNVESSYLVDGVARRYPDVGVDGPPREDRLGARHLATLAAQGARGDVVRTMMARGCRDIPEMIAARAPQVPDGCTRVTLGSNRYTMTESTQAARATLDRTPHLWSEPVVCEHTPGLHVVHDSEYDGEARHVVVWSDGRLDKALVSDPALYETPGPYTHPSEYEHTAPLLALILTAHNKDDLGPDTWTPWHGAQHRTTTIEREQHTRRTLGRVTQDAPQSDDEPASRPGLDHVAERRRTLTRHDITLTDGSLTHAWVLAEEIVEFRHIQEHDGNRWGHRHTIHTDHDQAHAAFEDLAAQEPAPAMTVTELATTLGINRDALAQALHRHAGPRTQKPQPWGTTLGRTRWLDPHTTREWHATLPSAGRPRKS